MKFLTFVIPSSEIETSSQEVLSGNVALLFPLLLLLINEQEQEVS
jgi:hypothetical protein